MRHSCRGASPLLVVFGLFSCSALCSAGSLQECALVADAGQRLACFDQLAAEAASTRLETKRVTAGSLSAAAPDAIDSRHRNEAKQLDNPFGLTAHRTNYILPITYNSNINREPFATAFPDIGMDDIEAKFQISFKARLWDISERFDLWAAYTQESWWQLYNEDESAPFRETNYQPELFLAYDADVELLGFRLSTLTLGLNHQSNGRGSELSRSWNRVMAGALLSRDRLAIQSRVWYRMPEDEQDDDNPETDDYYGYGDIRFAYTWNQMTFSTLLRNNLRSDDNHGALQLDWSFPLNRRFKGYVQYFNGYGESLIDYDVKTQRIGVGVMLTDWL